MRLQVVGVPSIASINSDNNQNCVKKIAKLRTTTLVALTWQIGGCYNNNYHSQYDPEVVPSQITRQSDAREESKKYRDQGK